MSTTIVRIADHMQVNPKAVESEGNLNSGRFDGQITKPVSMQGANKVSLTLTVHVATSGNDTLEMIIEQSNDESNWFEKARTQNITTSPAPLEASGVSMAWVRAVFVLDGGAQGVAPATGAVVTCDLSTSLE